MRYDIGHGHTVRRRPRSELSICTNQGLSISLGCYEPMYVLSELFRGGKS